MPRAPAAPSLKKIAASLKEAHAQIERLSKAAPAAKPAPKKTNAPASRSPAKAATAKR